MLSPRCGAWLSVVTMSLFLATTTGVPVETEHQSLAALLQSATAATESSAQTTGQPQSLSSSATAPVATTATTKAPRRTSVSDAATAAVRKSADGTAVSVSEATAVASKSTSLAAELAKNFAGTKPAAGTASVVESAAASAEAAAQAESTTSGSTQAPESVATTTATEAPRTVVATTGTTTTTVGSTTSAVETTITTADSPALRSESAVPVVESTAPKAELPAAPEVMQPTVPQAPTHSTTTASGLGVMPTTEATSTVEQSANPPEPVTSTEPTATPESLARTSEHTAVPETEPPVPLGADSSETSPEDGKPSQPTATSGSLPKVPPTVSTGPSILPENITTLTLIHYEYSMSNSTFSNSVGLMNVLGAALLAYPSALLLNPTGHQGKRLWIQHDATAPNYEDIITNDYLQYQSDTVPSSDPLLAANVRIPGRAHVRRSTVVTTDSGLPVGVVGFVSSNTQNGSEAQRLMVRSGDPVEAVREEARRLRGNGVPVVLALGNAGYPEDQLVAAGVEELDAVLVAGGARTMDGYPVAVRQEGGRMVPLLQAPADSVCLTQLVLNTEDNSLVDWAGVRVPIPGDQGSEGA